jgi:hypothetical protein
VILWTIQDMAAWERLQRKGVLSGDGRRVPAYYRHAYRWMADQMRLRLPLHGAKFPLWGWYRWQGTEQCRPDLRASGHLTKGTVGVRIEFDLPEENILLSDFNGWHCVLNRCFLSISEQEYEAFIGDLEKGGVEWGWPYPEPFHLRVVSSWQRIFDLEAGDVECWGLLCKRSIQATFWELAIPPNSTRRHIQGKMTGMM